MLTPLQELARVKSHTGLAIRLRSYEEVISVSISPERANVLVTTYEVRETARDLIFKRKGKRLISWRLEEGVWLVAGELILWDDDFEPLIIVKYGRRNTPAEVRAHRQFEKDCYRPGNSHTQLDSYWRVLDGASTEEMAKYW